MDAAERKDTDEDIRQTDKKDSDKDLLREVRLLKRRFLDESVKNVKVSKKAKLDEHIESRHKQNLQSGEAFYIYSKCKKTFLRKYVLDYHKNSFK